MAMRVMMRSSGSGSGVGSGVGVGVGSGVGVASGSISCGGASDRELSATCAPGSAVLLLI